MITVNIGLGLPDGVAELDPQDVAVALRGSFPGCVWSWIVHESGNHFEPERNVVAQLDIDAGADNYFAFIGKIYRLAVLLEQDCIAVSGHDTSPGELIGPNAADWGGFNPEFFVTFEEATS